MGVVWHSFQLDRTAPAVDDEDDDGPARTPIRPRTPRKKPPRQKNLTSRYKSGDLDEAPEDSGVQFKARNKTLQSDKMAKTADARIQAEFLKRQKNLHRVVSDGQFKGEGLSNTLAYLWDNWYRKSRRVMQRAFSYESRQQVTDCWVELEAQRADTEPKVFTAIHMHFSVSGRGIRGWCFSRWCFGGCFFSGRCFCGWCFCCARCTTSSPTSRSSC